MDLHSVRTSKPDDYGPVIERPEIIRRPPGDRPETALVDKDGSVQFRSLFDRRDYIDQRYRVG